MEERKNVYKLPAGDTTLLWYSRAVIEMKRRATTNPTSWNYQAAMHGFRANLPLWQGAGPFPGQAEQNQFWNQCQHQTWFFLPWHRMYLAFFEEIVRQTVVDLGGPQNWALPFWDYSDSTNPNARTIPPAFRTPANQTNGLWMPGRNNTVRERDVSLRSLNTQPYTGNGRTSPLGFGGPQTTFSHFGNTNGAVENSPHNAVHGSIGGAMGNPLTAALDPIFWLHHANIDRLWQVWLNRGNRVNPTQSAWLDFRFNLHDKDGNRVQMRCSEVRDTRQVLSGYNYEGVPLGGPVLESLAISDFSMPLEVIAATNQTVTLGSQTTMVPLTLQSPLRKKSDLETVLESVNVPQSTILHFENITGKGVPPIQDIYLNVPEDDGDKQSYYAGSLNLFGVEESSTPDLHHSGSGQHYALDISELMIKLRSLPTWKEQELDISIEPAWGMENASVTIGRISLYSE